MKPLKLLLFSMLMSGLSSAVLAGQPFVGLSAFAAFNEGFPCDNYLASLKGVEKPAMSVLWHSFEDMAARGDALYDPNSCPERFLKKYGEKRKKHLLQIFLANTYCTRKGTCSNTEVFKNLSSSTVSDALVDPNHDHRIKVVKGIRTKTKQVSDWLNAVKTADATDPSQAVSTSKKKIRRKVLLTLGLEDELSTEAMEAFYDIVTSYLKELGQKGIKIGRNPWRNTAGASEIALQSSQVMNRNKVFYELHPFIKKDTRAGATHFTSADSSYWDVDLGFGGRKCVANLDGVSVWTNPPKSLPKVYDDELKFHQEDGANTDVNSAKDFITKNKNCFAVFLWYSPLQGYFTAYDGKLPNDGDRVFRLSSHAAGALNDVMKNWSGSKTASKKARVSHNVAYEAPYQIRASHSTKCVDVRGVSHNNMATIQQWECLGTEQHNQAWYFKAMDDTYHQIISKHSGKCLDVEGVSLQDGARVQQYDCLGYHQSNQLWRLEHVGDSVQIIAKHSNKCLDVTGVSSDNGAQLQQYTCLGEGQKNQLWKVHDYSNHKTAIKTFWGSYVIAYPGNEFQGNSPNALQWETFELIEVGDNEYALKSYWGKYVSAHPSGHVAAEGTWIGPWERFKLIKRGNNQFSLQSPHGGYLVVLPDGQILGNSPNLSTWETFTFTHLNY